MCRTNVVMTFSIFMQENCGLNVKTALCSYIRLVLYIYSLAVVYGLMMINKCMQTYFLLIRQNVLYDFLGDK